MPEDRAVEITEGMQAYIDLNNRYLANRDRYIRETVKKWKFDTIAVHGLYSVADAIEDYQGAIIEPIFMSTAQAYRDADEMAAALAYKIPTWCYSRIANPSTYYYEWTMALLEGYPGLRTSAAVGRPDADCPHRRGVQCARRGVLGWRQGGKSRGRAAFSADGRARSALTPWGASVEAGGGYLSIRAGAGTAAVRDAVNAATNWSNACWTRRNRSRFGHVALM